MLQEGQGNLPFFLEGSIAACKPRRTERSRVIPPLPAAQTRDKAIQAFGWTALVIAAFVFAHPYDGIIHDNVLYLAQALLRLYPEIYGGDVYFQWGSQDRYTLFSPIYAWLIVHLGVNGATISLLALSHALFLAGSYALVRVLIPTGLRGYAMLFIVSSIGVYGGRLLFRMVESFVTPRGFVEAATLFAIVLLMSGRRGWAIGLLVGGVLLHPIMALAGLIYAWIYLGLEDRRWWGLATLGVVPVAAGLAGVAPFTQLFQSFDEKWLAILLVDNTNLFLTLWRRVDWSMAIFDAAVLITALQFAEGASRRAFRAALITAAVALGATFVFADLLHNVLISSLQPGRALWILHWMAAAALPFVAWRLWSGSAVSRLIAGLLVFAFVTRGLTTSLAASVLAVVLFHFRGRFTISERLTNLIICSLAAGAFVNWAAISLRVQEFAPIDSVTPVADFVLRALSKPFPLLVFSLSVAIFGLAVQHRTRIAAVLAVASLLVSLAVWDQRVPYMAYLDSSPLGSHPFSRFVSSDQQVLWHGNAAAPWIMMQRRSYFSDSQMSAQVFNREMSLEFARRREAIAPLVFQAELCKFLNALNNRNDSCEPDLETIREICRDAGDLDFIVLETPIANRWVAAWTWPVPVAGRRSNYYLYECKSLAAI